MTGQLPFTLPKGKKTGPQKLQAPAADTASDKIIFHGKSITGNGKDYPLQDHNVLAKSGRVYYNST